MFADPQSITISAATTSLPRVSTNGGATRYSSADGAIQEFVSHTANGKRIRSVLGLQISKYAADPLFPAQNTPYSATFKVFRDAPRGVHGCRTESGMGWTSCPARRYFGTPHDCLLWRAVVGDGPLHFVE